jgi:hypothetical protein
MTDRCVECDKEIPDGGKVHVGCALFALGEISEEERRKLVEEELREVGR